MSDPNPNRDDKGRFAPKSGALFAAGLLGVAVAVGVGSGTGGAVGAGEAVGADSPSLSVQVRSKRGSQRSGRTGFRLAARGLREVARSEADSGSCAADARGQVREFLATHACESVYRTLFVVRRGDIAAVVAVAWIDMASTGDAVRLKALVDRPRTGNVNRLPLPRGQQSVEVADPAYASRQRGNLVITVEVQPVAVTRGQRILDGIAEDAARSADAPG